MRSPIRRLLTLGRDERAATAVEFAMLVTPLVTLILASLQLSIIFFAGQELQSATISASRALMTGTVQQTTPAFTATTYRNQYVCPPVAFLLTCNNIMVDVQSGSTYAGINGAATTPISITINPVTGQPVQGNFSTGNPGDVLIVRVLYNWPVAGGQLLPGLADANGNHLLIGTSVFKTEPY